MRIILDTTQYIAKSDDYKYTLGTILGFVDDKSGYDYCTYGIAYGKINQGSTLVFDLTDQKYENLVFRIQSEKADTGEISFYANDHLVATRRLDSDDNIISFVIPKEYMTDGDILTIKLFTPERMTNNKKGNRTDLTIHSAVLESSHEKYDETNTLIPISVIKTGTEIGFSTDNQLGRQYVQYGFSFVEDGGTWMIDQESSLIFKMEEKRDYVLKLDNTAISLNQQIKVYANDVLVDEYLASGTENRQILLKREIINEDGTVELKIQHPNTNSGARSISIRLKSMTLMPIERIDTKKPVNLIFNKDHDITFSHLVLSGFSKPQQDGGIWTTKRRVEMKFFIESVDSKDIQIELHYQSYHGPQHVIIWANEDKIVEYDTGDTSEYKKITISQRTIKDGVIKLQFDLPDAVSPKSLGISENTSVLGLRIFDISIRAVE